MRIESTSLVDLTTGKRQSLSNLFSKLYPYQREFYAFDVLRIFELWKEREIVRLESWALRYVLIRVHMMHIC